MKFLTNEITTLKTRTRMREREKEMLTIDKN